VAAEVSAPTAERPDAPRSLPERGTLSPAAAGAIAAGQKLQRSTGPEGSEPLLSALEAARAGDALQACAPAIRQQLSALLEGLGGPAATTARAVFLRAVAARREALTSPGDRATAAAAVLASFAQRLAPLDSAAIAQRSTSLDLDSRRNTSDLDAQELWNKRGVIHDRGAGDAQADNDGLFQRFTGSCGPTTLQMMLAEADPVYAFELHEQGLTSDETAGPIADFQRRLLEQYGGVAIGRREAHLRARLRNGLGRLKATGDVAPADAAALLDHALRARPRTRAAERALAALRVKFDDFPSDEVIDRLRREPIPARDEGIEPDALQALLDDHLTPLTGVRYEQTRPPEGFARGQAWRHIDAVAAALKRGVDVPFGIVEPGHWMLLSAVRGKKPKRELLVSDPDGGRTAWVDERTFVRGTFGDDPFGLPDAGQRPYVDCFFLPVDR
jgi:hypothetical protein